MHPLEHLRDDALREIEAARDEKSLEGVRVKYLGKSGSISEWGERMKTLGKEERPVVGKLLNQARNAVTAALDQRGEKVRAEKESDALASIDISLPGTPHEIGSLHPLHQMHERGIEIFRRMGFALAEGPDVETEVQFRPHFFPFTEPSLEVYVRSKALKGGEQWIEVAGCGIVHPAVFEAVNKARGDNAYDPEKWSGYAFGLGMDRLAMILF